MRRSITFAAATVSLTLCFALAPAGCSALTWPELSKKMIDDCAKYERGIKDMTLTMEMSIPSSEGAMTSQSVLYRKGARFRAEVTLEGMSGSEAPAETTSMKTIVINDGKDVWIIAPMVGKSRVPPEEGNKYRGQWTCSDYIPADAQVIGSEKIDGRSCYVLSVIDSTSDIAKLWIDQKDFLLVKLEGKAREGEAMTARFSDFRTVSGGLVLAHRIEMFSGADLITTTVIKSVEFNTGFSDDLFDPDMAQSETPGAPKMMKLETDTLKTKSVE
ncbi:MAG TPA: outer membrane lipoprotein-sorting protein [Candidatus Bathyarchaeia archaeon]|nr:outer membrane lipoprotein-sorting protein [Candidatus Bathyarchaeia archaeon]